MMDILGYMRINESDPQRVKYLIACIRSYSFLKNSGRMVLMLDRPSDALFNKVLEECHLSFPNSAVIRSIPEKNYGDNYCDMMTEYSSSKFICNFMEDQFMVMDDPNRMASILQTMNRLNVDVLKSSFHKVELNSSYTLKGQPTQNGIVFENNHENHTEYQKHYKERFYIGVNFITTREFAYKVWLRFHGWGGFEKPHPYEVGVYDELYKHTCMIPYEEVQAAIDDDHGEEGTCLVKRDHPKFNLIMSQIP